MLDSAEPLLEVVVIGAGMAGLIAARELQRAGRQVVVLDKGRGAGGRLATRRIDGATFDHGAQGFAMGHAEFAEGIVPRHLVGSLIPWPETPTGSNPDPNRWRGNPTMSAIAKYLAQGIDVHLETTVTALHPEANHWVVQTSAGKRVSADSVILTTPVPQALAVIDAGGLPVPSALRSRLSAIDYDRCLAILAILEGPSRIPPPGGVAPGSEPLAWIVDNMLKGISTQPAVTLHATPRFSLEHWDQDRTATGRILLEAAAPWLGSPVKSFQVHGWRYSQPTVTDEARCRVVATHPFLVLAGDAFGVGGVEGAALSGAAAAETLLKAVSVRRVT